MNARDPILEMVTDWQDKSLDRDDATRLSRILADLRFLERTKFSPYIPTLYSRHPSAFTERLYRWLNNPNLTSAQQRDLFEFAHCIAFFSFDDFATMFQNAFSGPISRWCMSHAGIRLYEHTDWHDRLDIERFKHTWFCPITDSLLISVFHHVNEIEGKNRKPAFRELMHFGDASKIQQHISEEGYKRLVLLEDFVGTGTQCFKTVEWAVSTLQFPVLFCPMIIAPEGADRYRELKAAQEQKRIANRNIPIFDFEPVFELDNDCFVHSSVASPNALLARIRKLAEEVHKELSNSGEEFKKGALGFWKEKSPQKGATVVMFSNTPNNSVPLIFHGAETWSPLFPRVDRKPL